MSKNMNIIVSIITKATYRRKGLLKSWNFRGIESMAVVAGAWHQASRPGTLAGSKNSHLGIHTEIKEHIGNDTSLLKTQA